MASGTINAKPFEIHDRFTGFFPALIATLNDSLVGG
jgi:hypothetical protein